MAEGLNILSYFRPLKGSLPAQPYYMSKTICTDGELRTEIEDNVGKCSEISITFKQIYRNTYTNLEIEYLIMKYIDYCIDYFDLDYILLVSEYGESHNLHFHGLIKGNRKNLSEMKLWLNKRWGRSTIKSIQYTESYAKYLMKEQDNITEYYKYKK